MSIDIEVPGEPVKKPFPWWIVAVAAALLLSVGSVTAYLLLREKTTETAAPPAVADSAAAPAKESAPATSPATPPAASPSPPPVTTAGGGSEVPNVVGTKQDDAEAKLKSAGLVVAGVERRMNEQSAGTVLDQTPKSQSGVTVPAGYEVRLVVSDGGAKVPNLVGYNLAGARESLRGLQLVPKEVPVKRFDGYGAGHDRQSEPGQGRAREAADRGRARRGAGARPRADGHRQVTRRCPRHADEGPACREGELSRHPGEGSRHRAGAGARRRHGSENRHAGEPRAGQPRGCRCRTWSARHGAPRSTPSADSRSR